MQTTRLQLLSFYNRRKLTTAQRVLLLQLYKFCNCDFDYSTLETLWVSQLLNFCSNAVTAATTVCYTSETIRHKHNHPQLLQPIIQHRECNFCDSSVVNTTLQSSCHKQRLLQLRLGNLCCHCYSYTTTSTWLLQLQLSPLRVHLCYFYNLVWYCEWTWECH